LKNCGLFPHSPRHDNKGVWLMVNGEWLMKNACDTFVMAEGFNLWQQTVLSPYLQPRSTGSILHQPSTIDH
jgi:hypothetical protein